jgi:hypothetical protein
MKRGLYLAPFHELADPRLLAELARVAESRGWDGLFLWDRIAYPPSDRAVGGTQRHRFQDGQPSFPGPIFGIILGLPILGLAVAEAVGATRDRRSY